MQRFLALFALICFFPSVSPLAHSQDPIADAKLIFGEKDGLVAVEAEHFFKQEQTDKRAFYLTHSQQTPAIKPDGDPNHAGGASGGAY